MGDSNRMRQIIVNLVGNAIKFTSQGEIGVNLRLDHDHGIEQIHGVVSDTGIGIPPDKLSAVFEAFRQTDSSTTRRKFGGTGLGLNITLQLVELMGGRIWVESELGKGSQFHFIIPLDRRSRSVRYHGTAVACRTTRNRACHSAQMHNARAAVC